MVDEELVAELPPMTAVALRLRAARVSDEIIAVATGIPVQGVLALVEVAEAKLGHLRVHRADRSGRPDDLPRENQ